MARNKGSVASFATDINFDGELMRAVQETLGRAPTQEEFSRYKAVALGASTDLGIAAGDIVAAANAAVQQAAPITLDIKNTERLQAEDVARRAALKEAETAKETKAAAGRTQIQDILGAALPATVDPALRAVLEQAVTKQTEQGVSAATAEAARRGITGSSIESFGQATQRGLGTETLSRGLAALLQQSRAEEERKRALQVQSIAQSAGISETEANNLLNALLSQQIPQNDPNALLQSLLLASSGPGVRRSGLFNTILGGLETAGGIVGTLLGAPAAAGLIPGGLSTLGAGISGEPAPPLQFSPGFASLFQTTPKTPKTPKTTKTANTGIFSETPIT